MDDDRKQSLLDYLDKNELDFEKTAQELKQHDYNLSYEYYLSQNRDTSYPNLENARTEFEQAKADLNDALEGFKRLMG